jgi:hypothetical protein
MDSKWYIPDLHGVTNDNSAFVPIVAPRIVSLRRRNRCYFCVCVYKEGDSLLHVGVCCKSLASEVLCMGSISLIELVIGYGAAGGGLWTTLLRVTFSRPHILSAMENLRSGRPNSVYYRTFPSVRGNISCTTVFREKCVL